VAEIRLEPLAGKVRKRNISLSVGKSMLGDVTPHLDISAAVVVLVAKATPYLRSGVPLLGRRGLVVAKDFVDDRLNWSEDWCGAIPGRRNGTGLGMIENLPNSIG
jgi:hypothetical protein